MGEGRTHQILMDEGRLCSAWCRCSILPIHGLFSSDKLVVIPSEETLSISEELSEHVNVLCTNADSACQFTFLPFLKDESPSGCLNSLEEPCVVSIVHYI